jgi:nucleoside-diphosphate-sugar epimerase
MRVLVTGGAGRIGTYVVSKLKATHEVTVFDLSAPGDIAVSFIQGDIHDRERTWKALKGIDAVVHLAGIPVYTGENTVFMDTNISGTFNILEGAVHHQVRKIVFASSICSYGFIFSKARLVPDYFPIDESHPTTPDDMYGISKLVGEQMCGAYSKRYGISSICLRMATVWLPGNPRTDKFLAWLGNPELGADFLWNYVDVRDAVQAFSLALDKDTAFDVFNIGARNVASNRDTLELVSRFYPDVKDIKDLELFRLEPDRALFDISKARKGLCYEPTHTWKEYVQSM